MSEVRFVCNYGPIVPKRLYTVIDEGYDWIRVRYRGGCIYVPTNFIDTNNEYDAEEMERSLDEIDRRNDLVDEIYNV